MDEGAAWYGSRPRLRPHCTRLGPSSRERGTALPSFRPMSIVVTVAHLSHCWAKSRSDFYSSLLTIVPADGIYTTSKSSTSFLLTHSACCWATAILTTSPYLPPSQFRGQNSAIDPLCMWLCASSINFLVKWPLNYIFDVAFILNESSVPKKVDNQTHGANSVKS